VTQLAQAYIHLKPYNAPDKRLRSLGRYAERVALKVAAEIYGEGVEIVVELEEGSLRTRVTVIGALLLGGYYAVGNYSGFKASIIEMCDDARDFSVDVCRPFVSKAGVAPEEVYRFERRLKTPGRIYRLGRRLEKLERGAGDLSSRAMQQELAKARTELMNIAEDLSAAELAKLESSLPQKRLPPPKNWPDSEPARVADRLEREKQTDLAFDELPETDREMGQRVVFRSRRKVTGNAKKRRIHRTKKDDHPSLLPAPDSD
jgi:hypothetical protein